VAADEPILTSLADDLIDTLKTMSRANGYWYDYGEIIEGISAGREATDAEVPNVYVAYEGTLPSNAETGNESATRRFRHTERYTISVFIEDEKVQRKAYRVRSDVHKALMPAASRARGRTLANTFDAGCVFELADEAGEARAGLLTLFYNVRWQHASGDMSTDS
jgi:hypothetical protein